MPPKTLSKKNSEKVQLSSTLQPIVTTPNGQIALAPGISAQSKAIPEEEDYILTMKEVQEIRVRAQLVVLSCCHSGRGEIRAEGVVGMSRAFLAAGARAVVASLWAIDDYVTLEFMASFYKFLRYGDSASLSLKNAMEELRGNRRYSEPKYWAPFFLIGDDIPNQLIQVLEQKVRSLDLKNDVGKVNGNLGILYYSLGTLNEAMQCYQMSLETAHDEH
ncbi:hypothetical protein QZH41_015981, partial [Actinostola sp. cb2023]